MVPDSPTFIWIKLPLNSLDNWKIFVAFSVYGRRWKHHRLHTWSIGGHFDGENFGTQRNRNCQWLESSGKFFGQAPVTWQTNESFIVGCFMSHLNYKRMIFFAIVGGVDSGWGWPLAEHGLPELDQPDLPDLAQAATNRSLLRNPDQRRRRSDSCWTSKSSSCVSEGKR